MAFLFLILVVIAYKFVTSKITSIIAYSSFEIIHSAIFFLSALILLDIRKSNKLKLFSWFILGVFLLGFSELYTERIKYYQSFYRYFVHIGHIVALGMIFFGIEENLFRSKIFSLKQKLLAYISIFSIFSYFFMSVIIALLFKFYMPHYMNIFFWCF
jgi:hypothetical protein